MQRRLTKFSLWRVLWLEESLGQSYVCKLPLLACLMGGESCVGLLPVVIILDQFFLMGRRWRRGWGREGLSEEREGWIERGGGGREGGGGFREKEEERVTR